MLLDNILGFPRAPMQRAYNWDFILPSFGWAFDGIAVSKFCQSCRFGQYDIGEIMARLGAHQQFFPGDLSIGPISATFVTSIPDLVSLYFMRWKKRIVDDDGFYYPSKYYKKNIYVILYDRTGIPSNFIQLNKVFPVKFPVFDLSYKEEKMVEFTVEFKVDRIRMGTKALGEMGTIGKTVAGAVEGVIGGIREAVGL